MSTDFNALLQSFEVDLRSGKTAHVVRKVTALNSQELPRPMIIQFANIARRAGAVSVGLRLLSPLIYSERNRWQAEATAQELAEFAVLLQNCGAVSEALRLLEKVDCAQVPEAHLYRAFCHFNRWQYDEAIPCLENYLSSPLPAYQRLVGQVNLAAALLSAGDLNRAGILLEQNIETANANQNDRLLGNCLEMRAQLRIRAQEYDGAKSDLARAGQLVGETTIDQTYVQKWSAIAQAMQSHSDLPLLAFREECQRKGQWEAVRDLDLYRLKINFDAVLFEQLVFGTPYASYRLRLQQELGEAVIPNEILLGDRHGRILDLVTGELDGISIMNAGKKIHQTLAILARDLYAPVKVGSLFTELFPGDHFDVNSSPDRLHRVLRRTRRWIESQNLPLTIVSENGFYRLQVGAGLALRLQLETPEIQTHAIEFAKLRKMMNEGELTSRDVRTVLNQSPSAFNKFIRWALEKNLVVRQGHGRSVSYQYAA